MIKEEILGKAKNTLVDFLESLGCDDRGQIPEDSPLVDTIHFDKYEPKAYLFDDVYVVRPVYTGPEAAFHNLPNFENKVTGFKLYWTPSIRKSLVSNMEVNTLEEFKNLLNKKV